MKRKREMGYGNPLGLWGRKSLGICRLCNAMYAVHL